MVTENNLQKHWYDFDPKDTDSELHKDVDVDFNFFMAYRLLQVKGHGCIYKDKKKSILVEINLSWKYFSPSDYNLVTEQHTD